MSEIMRFVKGDHTQTIRMTCTDENGTALNLANVNTATLKLGRIGEASNLVSEEGSITDAANGIVDFTFEDGDLDTAGYYDAHIELDYSTGVHKSLRYFGIHILPDMA